MDVVIDALAAIAPTALAVVYSWRRGEQAWKTVADKLDFTYTIDWRGWRKLHGYRRGFDVQIRETLVKNRGKVLQVQVSNLDPGFTLSYDNALQRMLKPDIETGDPMFDERTRIEGDPEWALALLSDEARQLTEVVIWGWNGQLSENTLSASYKGIGRTASKLATILDFAQLLRQPALHELPRRLMERACHDSCQPVRFKAFRLLATSYPSTKEAAAAAETLFDSLPTTLRLEACRLLVKSSSEKSEAANGELVGVATHPGADASVRCSALQALSESRHQQIAVSAMRQVLEQPETPPVVRRAALESLIKAEAKTELLTIPTEGEIEGEILARGLGRFDTSVQPRLLRFLDDAEDRVCIAAVKSLGKVGDLDAIRDLRQIADQNRILKSALVREAELAIANIKSRFDGSQHGEISIITVAPLEGAISPSDDSEAGGEVSLTP